MANTPVYLLTDFSCCEDFEKFLKAQNHANRALLDTLTQNMVDDWNKKACNLAILGGNLCLLDKDGNNLASVSMLVQDGDTITRDPVTGEITCVKVKVKGLDKSVNLWMGTTAEYAAIKTKSPDDTVYFFTNVNLYDVYTTLTNLEATIRYISAGSILVPKAKHATNADHADSADQSTNANYANSAGTADHATHADDADKSTNANYASFAGTATHANNATHATDADRASEAEKDSSGNIFEEVYANFGVSKTRYTRYNSGDTLDTGLYIFRVTIAKGNAVKCYTEIMEITPSQDCQKLLDLDLASDGRESFVQLVVSTESGVGIVAKVVKSNTTTGYEEDTSYTIYYRKIL